MTVIQSQLGNDTTASILRDTEWAKPYMERMESIPGIQAYMKRPSCMKHFLHSPHAKWRGRITKILRMCSIKRIGSVSTFGTAFPTSSRKEPEGFSTINAVFCKTFGQLVPPGLHNDAFIQVLQFLFGQFRPRFRIFFPLV